VRTGVDLNCPIQPFQQRRQIDRFAQDDFRPQFARLRLQSRIVAAGCDGHPDWTLLAANAVENQRAQPVRQLQIERRALLPVQLLNPSAIVATESTLWPSCVSSLTSVVRVTGSSSTTRMLRPRRAPSVVTGPFRDNGGMPDAARTVALSDSDSTHPNSDISDNRCSRVWNRVSVTSVEPSGGRKTSNRSLTGRCNEG